VKKEMDMGTHNYVGTAKPAQARLLWGIIIHCECGTVWTQEMHTVCPNCGRWPKRSAA